MMLKKFGRAVVQYLSNINQLKVDVNVDNPNPPKSTHNTRTKRGNILNNPYIVLIGGFGSGKSEFIYTLTGLEKVKPFFHGAIEIPPQTGLVLYEPPVSWRFLEEFPDFSLEQKLGTIIVLNTARLELMLEARAIVRSIYYYHTLPFIIVCNPYEYDADTEVWVKVPAIDPVFFRHYLRLPAHIPIVECDVANREQAKHTLITFLEHVRDSLEDEG